jgi:hypothetical protein
MNWISFWINTFITKTKVKPTFEKGIKSTVYSSAILGVLFFLVSLLSADSQLLSSFVMSVIVIPIAALVGVLIFAGVFRLVASQMGGKGSFKKDSAVIGMYTGSALFVGGIVMILFLLINSAFLSGTDAASTNFFVVLVVLGAMLAVIAYLAAIIFAVLLEELGAAEKADIFSTAKMLGVAVIIVTLAFFAIYGAVIELQLGPYKAMLAQYGTLGNSSG